MLSCMAESVGSHEGRGKEKSVLACFKHVTSMNAEMCFQNPTFGRVAGCMQALEQESMAIMIMKLCQISNATLRLLAVPTDCFQ